MPDRTPVLGIACLILALLLAVMYVIATPARSQEQVPCAPHAALEKELTETYGETIVGAGVTANGYIYVSANPRTHTFTIILRRPNGLACIIGGGKGWASVGQEKPGADL